MPSSKFLRGRPRCVSTERNWGLKAKPAVAAGWAVGFCCLLSGCVFLTPPTGVCLGAACQDLELKRAQAATEAEQAAQQREPLPLKRYEAPDFALSYRGEWEPAAKRIEQPDGTEALEPIFDETDPTGLSTLRIAVGVALPLQGGGSVSEGLRVLTINQGLGDSADAEAALANLTKRSIAQNFAGEPEVIESQAKLGNRDAYQVVMVGAGPSGGLPMRSIARALTHQGRGYIILLTVPDILYTRDNLTYDRVLDSFEWRAGAPPYPLPSAPPAVIQDPTATPSASDEPAKTSTSSAAITP